MKFSEIVQVQIDGKPVRAPDPLARQKRIYLKLKALQDHPRDPFWFRVNGKVYQRVQRFRGSSLVHFSGQSSRVTIDLADIESVELLGYQRQRQESHGSVDYYTHDKSIRSERSF